jgi:hypothetical protein
MHSLHLPAYILKRKRLPDDATGFVALEDRTAEWNAAPGDGK